MTSLPNTLMSGRPARALQVQQNLDALNSGKAETDLSNVSNPAFAAKGSAAGFATDLSGKADVGLGNVSAPAFIAKLDGVGLKRITPKSYGAVGDCISVFNTSITVGQAIVTNNVDQPFAAAHVGANVWLINAGAAASVLVGTVISRQSASQITISANALTTQLNGRCVVAHNDNAATLLALADCVPTSGGAGKTLFLDDNFYMVDPFLLPNRGAARGNARGSSGFVLRPGSATVNKYLIRTGAGNFKQTLEAMTLNGLRDFHMSGGVLPKDINILDINQGFADTAEVDAFSFYHNLFIQEAGRAGIKWGGKGEIGFNNIRTVKTQYAYDINGFDSGFDNVQGTAYSTAFLLGSSSGSLRFATSKGYFAEGNQGDGLFGLDEVCWALNGASNCDFAACEGQESFGTCVLLNGAKRNTFSSFRAADAGCVALAPGHGQTGRAAPAIRASWRLINDSNDNEWSAGRAGVGVHASTNYATHAVLIEGTSTGNKGNIETDQYATAWATAKTASTTTGTNPRLSCDGVAFP